METKQTRLGQLGRSPGRNRKECRGGGEKPGTTRNAQLEVVPAPPGYPALANTSRLHGARVCRLRHLTPWYPGAIKGQKAFPSSALCDSAITPGRKPEKCQREMVSAIASIPTVSVSNTLEGFVSLPSKMQRADVCWQPDCRQMQTATTTLSFLREHGLFCICKCVTEPLRRQQIPVYLPGDTG